MPKSKSQPASTQQKIVIQLLENQLKRVLKKRNEPYIVAAMILVLPSLFYLLKYALECHPQWEEQYKNFEEHLFNENKHMIHAQVEELEIVEGAWKDLINVYFAGKMENIQLGNVQDLASKGVVSFKKAMLSHHESVMHAILNIFAKINKPSLLKENWLETKTLSKLPLESIFRYVTDEQELLEKFHSEFIHEVKTHLFAPAIQEAMLDIFTFPYLFLQVFSKYYINPLVDRALYQIFKPSALAFDLTCGQAEEYTAHLCKMLRKYNKQAAFIGPRSSVFSILAVWCLLNFIMYDSIPPYFKMIYCGVFTQFLLDLFQRKREACAEKKHNKMVDEIADEFAKIIVPFGITIVYDKHTPLYFRLDFSNCNYNGQIIAAAEIAEIFKRSAIFLKIDLGDIKADTLLQTSDPLVVMVDKQLKSRLPLLKSLFTENMYRSLLLKQLKNQLQVVIEISKGNIINEEIFFDDNALQKLNVGFILPEILNINWQKTLTLLFPRLTFESSFMEGQFHIKTQGFEASEEYYFKNELHQFYARLSKKNRACEDSIRKVIEAVQQPNDSAPEKQLSRQERKDLHLLAAKADEEKEALVVYPATRLGIPRDPQLEKELAARDKYRKSTPAACIYLDEEKNALHLRLKALLQSDKSAHIVMNSMDQAAIKNILPPETPATPETTVVQKSTFPSHTSTARHRYFKQRKLKPTVVVNLAELLPQRPKTLEEIRWSQYSFILDRLGLHLNDVCETQFLRDAFEKQRSKISLFTLYMVQLLRLLEESNVLDARQLHFFAEISSTMIHVGAIYFYLPCELRALGIQNLMNFLVKFNHDFIKPCLFALKHDEHPNFNEINLENLHRDTFYQHLCGFQTEIITLANYHEIMTNTLAIALENAAHALPIRCKVSGMILDRAKAMDQLFHHDDGRTQFYAFVILGGEIWSQWFKQNAYRSIEVDGANKLFENFRIIRNSTVHFDQNYLEGEEHVPLNEPLSLGVLYQLCMDVQHIYRLWYQEDAMQNSGPHRLFKLPSLDDDSLAPINYAENITFMSAAATAKRF